MRTFVACLALSFVAPAFSAEDSFPRTDARTWSREGAFKVRWGMGPGDVKSIYPSLGQNRFFYSTVDFVEGMDVLVLFWFFQNRLYKIEVISSQKTPLKTMADFDTLNANQKAWAKRLEPVLTEKYGPPIVDEGAAVRTLQWRKSNTGVWLTCGERGARVGYADLLVVDAAEAAARSGWDAAEKAEAAAEHDRL